MKARIEYFDRVFLLEGDGPAVKLTPSLTVVGLPREYREALTPMPGAVLWAVDGQFVVESVREDFEIIINGLLSRGGRIIEKDFDLFVR